MGHRGWTGKVFIAASLDGFIAKPGGDLAWLQGEPDAGHAAGDPHVPDDFGYAEHMAEVDHIVMGRGTYEKVLTFDSWPYAGTDVIVMSSGLDSDDDRVTVVRSLEECVAMLDERGARGVYVDGGATIQAFLRAGLIDTIVLTRIPVLIGRGKPLFGPVDEDIHLVHERTITASNGYVQSRYRIPRRARGS
jgi:dihydrofolate reductase